MRSVILSTDRANKSKKNEQKEKIRVSCVKCNYKFHIYKNANVNPRCPYCDSNRFVKDKTAAQALIDEVTNKESYYENPVIKKYRKY